jgi:hypothetical protein
LTAAERPDAGVVSIVEKALFVALLPGLAYAFLSALRQHLKRLRSRV